MNRKPYKILALVLGCALLAACGQGSLAEARGEEALTTTDTAAQAMENTDMFTRRDRESSYDETGIRISLEGTTARSDSKAVNISGGTVTISEEGCYVLSGTLDEGMIIIDAAGDTKMQLVLEGAHINNSGSAAIYVRQADKVFLTIADGTENSLSNGGSFRAIDENNIDAALYSKDDLSINGEGTLTVTSPAGHGIVCKDDLVICGGGLDVSAADHGLDANDSVRIAGGKLSITAGKDGIHAENSDDARLGFVYVSGGELDIQAQGDGISAGAYAWLEGGGFTLLCGGGSENGSKERSDLYGGFMGRPQAPGAYTAQEDDSGSSMKGVKAAGELLISGGSYVIDSADDALHSDKSVTISGGSFEISSGDDAVHAEETLTVSAGSLSIAKSYEGLEALRVYVQGGDINILADDDGINAAGGVDSSGFEGGRDGRFPPHGGMGGPGAAMGSSDGEISISGGRLCIVAYGDGLDANGSISISGGDTVVCSPVQGDTATLDYDVSAAISGGSFTGTGAYGMAQSFSHWEQGLIAVGTGNRAAGTELRLEDESGALILSHTPQLDYAVLIVSSPNMISGEKYTLSVGTDSAELEAK